jgi:hypothetical protein
MDTAVVTGAFTLGGVALGTALNWLNSAVEGRRTAARERDELVVAMGAACAQLLAEAHTWRVLDRPGSKLRQAAYGVLESEARRPFAVGDDVTAVARQLMASAAVNGLRYLFPVGVAERLRAVLLPLMSEIGVLAIRLSMTRDAELTAASVRITAAVGSLVENLAARERDHAKREAELNAALGELRQARDAVMSRRWHKRRSTSRPKKSPDTRRDVARLL